MAKPAKKEYLQQHLIVRNPNPETLNKMEILGYEVSQEDAVERVADLSETGKAADLVAMGSQEFYIYKLVEIIRPQITITLNGEDVK